jgi:hypothetical protein
MAQLILNGKQQFFDDNRNPLAGGSVAFYQPGTLTPVNTYTDRSLTTANPNPVILDAAGRGVMWGQDSVAYRQIVKDYAGNVIWDQVTTIDAVGNPMTSAGDLISQDEYALITRIPIGAVGQFFKVTSQSIGDPATVIPFPQWATPVASDVGADPAGTAAALGGIGGQATLVLSGYPIQTGVGVITVSASAPSGTPVDGQLWFQHA